MCIVNSTLRASYTHFVRSSHCCRGCARTMRMCVDNPVKDARMPHAAHKRMSRAFAFEGATVYLDLATASCSERTANLRAARTLFKESKHFESKKSDDCYEEYGGGSGDNDSTNTMLENTFRQENRLFLCECISFFLSFSSSLSFRSSFNSELDID